MLARSKTCVRRRTIKHAYEGPHASTYLCAHIHACMSTHTHVCMHSHMCGGHTCIRACSCILLLLDLLVPDTFKRFRVRTSVCTQTRDCPHIHVYTHMNAHTCACTQLEQARMCMQAHTHRDVQDEHAFVHANNVTKCTHVLAETYICAHS